MIKNFLAGLDTPGGHMAICLVLIVYGTTAHMFYPTDSLVHDLVIAATGVLFGAMKGQNGGRVTVNAPIPAPPAPPPDSTTTTTVATTIAPTPAA